MAGRSGRLAARDVVVLLIFGCRLVQTVLRMAIGALVVYICEEYGCSPAGKAWLLSAHAFGYCTTQVLGGLLADRLGGKPIITVSLAMAGLALAGTPPAAAALGLQGLAALQVVMGVALGPLFPASMQILARWLPPGERAFASTMLDTGITAGSLVAVPLSGLLSVSLGWQAALAAFGLAALGYGLLWALCAAERPERCSYCGDEERAFLVDALPLAQKPSTATGSFLSAFGHARLWAIYAAHFAFNYSVYFVTSWSASYYLELFGLRPEHAGLHLSLPHAANLLVKVAASPVLARALRAGGCSDLTCRKTFTGLGFLVPALCLRLVPLCSGPRATTACFSVALGFMALHPSGFKANYMDVTTRSGGLVSGVGNTIASVASSMGPLWVSQLRQATGSWEPVFRSVACVNLLAALVFCSLASTRAIEAQDAAPELPLLWGLWQRLRPGQRLPGSEARLARRKLT